PHVYRRSVTSEHGECRFHNVALVWRRDPGLGDWLRQHCQPSGSKGIFAQSRNGRARRTGHRSRATGPAVSAGERRVGPDRRSPRNTTNVPYSPAVYLSVARRSAQSTGGASRLARVLIRSYHIADEWPALRSRSGIARTGSGTRTIAAGRIACVGWWVATA